MGVKILLADDSPTVHKVIKIILANEPFEVVECSREADLIPKLEQHNPTIVFLDFNFSENLTGYDLCRSIKDKSPSTKVLMMYGTFDAIDEATLLDSGADQHVIKPFDTNRFVFQVRALADTTDPEPMDEWNVRETVEKQTPDVQQMTQDTVGTLDDSLSDWGMMVPGVIGKTEGSPELPPVIGEESLQPQAQPQAMASIVDHQAHATEAQAIPNEQDLEYPDFGKSLEIQDAPKPKSKLIALNELAPDGSNDSGRTPGLELNTEAEDEGIKNIESQIRDEIEADLWSVDAFEEVNPKLAAVKSQSTSFVEDDYSFTATPVQETKTTTTTTTNYRAPAPSQGISLDMDSLRPMLQEMIQQAVKEYCEKHADKVAWEIIPDLAENLIKKELHDLARKAAQE